MILGPGAPKYLFFFICKTSGVQKIQFLAIQCSIVVGVNALKTQKTGSKNKIHYWIFSKKDLFQRFISSFNCLRTEFSPEFLTILISTNRAVYDGGQDVRYKLKGQCHKIFFLTHRKTKEKFYLSFLNSQLVSSVIEHSTRTYTLYIMA